MRDATALACRSHDRPSARRIFAAISSGSPYTSYLAKRYIRQPRSTRAVYRLTSRRHALPAAVVRALVLDADPVLGVRHVAARPPWRRRSSSTGYCTSGTGSPRRTSTSRSRDSMGEPAARVGQPDGAWQAGSATGPRIAGGEPQDLLGREPAAVGQRVDGDHALDGVLPPRQVVRGPERRRDEHAAHRCTSSGASRSRCSSRPGCDRTPLPGTVSSTGAPCGPHEAPSSSAAEYPGHHSAAPAQQEGGTRHAAAGPAGPRGRRVDVGEDAEVRRPRSSAFVTSPARTATDPRKTVGHHGMPGTGRRDARHDEEHRELRGRPAAESEKRP